MRSFRHCIPEAARCPRRIANSGFSAKTSSRPKAHAYGTALNALLSIRDGVDATGRPRWKHRVEIGDVTTADARGGPEAAERAEAVFSWTLDPPVPTDEQDAAKVRSVLQKIERGRIERIDELGGRLDPETRFYVLGLSPNAGRISVRFFLESTLGALIAHAAQHYQDLLIEPHRWTAPPSLWRLLRNTAPRVRSPNEKPKISPALTGELARKVLIGDRYPQMLLTLTLMRLRADGEEMSDIRAAICKACIIRDHRKGFEREGVPVALDRNETNIGYRLGRLFALLERAQRTALGKVNATVRDKYFGSASMSPARVFPLLLRGVQDHIGKLRSGGKGGLAYWYDQQISEVMSGLPSHQPFPSILRLEDQGRFAVGYYHQMSARGDANLAAEEDEETEMV
jgi:CRISPR-associated protein Csd1